MDQNNEEVTPNGIKELCKSLCKIIIGNKTGSGFFMKSKIQNLKKSHFLVTNFHVISNDIINNKQEIEIDIEYNNEKRIIQLGNKKRFIRCFPKPIDITIIEILKEDKLDSKIQYLKIDNLIDKEYKAYLSKDIYILHHPKGGEGKCSLGKITNIDDYTFLHNAYTNEGSSGSPIVLADSFNLIGIHCGKNKKINNINIGVFIEKIKDLNDQNLFKNLDKDKENLIFFNDFDPAPSLKEGNQIINLR